MSIMEACSDGIHPSGRQSKLCCLVFQFEMETKSLLYLEVVMGNRRFDIFNVYTVGWSSHAVYCMFSLPQTMTLK